MILANARLVFSDGLRRGNVRLGKGRITDISENPLVVLKDEKVLDLAGEFLAPGFIDLHIHGALRRDSMEASAEAFAEICRFHARGGTTALALTTVTATDVAIRRTLAAVQRFREKAPVGARVLGVHLEGPYFSREKPGAHVPGLIREPRRAEWERWLEEPGLVTQMTVAPELPGALELIEALAARGIIASGGHTDAWDEEAAAGFAHGMRQATHTFNCMSSTRHRGPFRAAGMLEFALGEPEMLCELIADGRHVSPTLMRMLYHAKGPDGIVLVTDAAGGAGLPEGEHFFVGDIEGVVRDEVALTADGRTLCSSTAPMIRLVRNMVQLVEVPLVEAVRMATRNPARALRLEARKGLLAVGADADLVSFTDDFAVTRTFVGGRDVLEPAASP